MQAHNDMNTIVRMNTNACCLVPFKPSNNYLNKVTIQIFESIFKSQIRLCKCVVSVRSNIATRKNWISYTFNRDFLK